MKRIFLFAAILFSLTAMAQMPVITFDKTTHDFGKINEADGRVTTVFEFKNEGMVPLVLTNVRASCGCTTPKWTREPIEPGQTGTITVTYNPSGRPGRFQKTVTVTSNTEEATTRLYIKGEVIPKPAAPAVTYPVKMGPLSLNKNSLNFGVLIKREGGKMFSIEYANLTDQAIKVQLMTSNEHSYLKPQATLQNVQPGETGKLQFALQTMECPLWGPIEAKAYVVINDQPIYTDEYAITIKAELKEDFSKMTVEELQQAPIIDVKIPDLDTLKANKKYNARLTISNAGINPLVIRRIITSDETITITAPKATIKGGRKTDINMLINTAGLESGNYSRMVTIITNDPKKSILKLSLNWVVE